MPRSLDLVITSVATQLMEATGATATRVSERVLEQLVEQFNLDAAFLRHHDHDIRASVLVAEWPRRVDVPDPDPMAVIHFTSVDAVFGDGEHGRKPVVIRPDQATRSFALWSGPRAATKQPAAPSVAAAPLVSGEATTGVLGFVRYGARKWKQEEINTLEAAAALFAQLQARIAAEEKLRYLAEHDDLTGLYNRRALVAHLTERLIAGSPGPVSVLYLDLDRLKPINDYLGHTAGDWFIRVFAQRLRACAGIRSMIARLGGDEFVVIPEQPMSTATAESLARRLCATLRERLAIGGHMITRTVSIGVAVGVPGRDNSTDLLRRADEAVLTAKRGGGNQVAMSTDDMSLKSAFRNDIELHLQGDIDSEALLLHYLPEVDLWTGAIVAAEALVRWRHPIWGLLLPDSFIGVAESTNLAGELGRWVMRTACADFSRWRSKGIGLSATLRINVSPVQLITRGFVRSVADTIDEFGIDAGSVCLEITERAVVHDMETTRKTLSELKDVGVQIAIDDFGTGYAVLSHLKSLPVDTLKIDTAFVRDLGTNAGDLAIVRAIIGLAEAFGLQLVAEGVETPAAALTLMQHGCHRAQGFLLSRPVPAGAMEALLAARWMPMPFLADREALSLGAI
ncbi:putative bifunctional diguanylate cyclase/phosphodiesterase [Mycobacterium sp. Marseille-P9652]|uniref:putative bifunctional diguanylate cyclase/phosphodiesterase n=1 Tax=Mycobacterium sp. Marseille-P9652 TaxID=2654950 RepID=UPI0012E83CE0|nr:EAL domain-containing protein [Mycobacterium sp. Marseille-P9652]